MTVTFVQDKAVQLFHAFAPMLCKRPTKKIEDSVKEMGGSEFFIDEKLDGERIQLHKKGNEYFYCSRFATLPSNCINCYLSPLKQERERLHLSIWETYWNR